MRKVRFYGFVAAILIIAGSLSGTTTPGAQATVDVRELVDKQVAAWNHGDLDGYMAGYWKSDRLSFFSNAKETLGWQQTLEHYRDRYQKNKNGMGKLELTIQLEQLDNDLVLGKGEWRLSMPGGTHPHGLTTIVVRKLPEGWRIVHDHSSAD